MHEHDPLISEYQHENLRPRAAEALQTLRKVASLVKPIMRQRGWTVGILTEFYPQEQNLLGLNHNRGQKICLRLRYPGDERQFLPLDEVVDTMLHELCHNVHNAHDEAFHKLWNQLRDEHDNLVRKGYTGEGFLSTGHKLGGGRIPMHEARRRARAAAEQRRVLTAGSGQKLGGTAVRRGQDIRKVIADAATRRTTVTKGCASGTEREKGLVEEASKNGFKTKAEEEDANEQAMMQAYIEMIQEEEREKYGKDYIQPSNSNPAGSRGSTVSNVKPERGSQAVAAPSKVKPERSLVVPTRPKPQVPANVKSPTLTKPKPAKPSLIQNQPPLDCWSCKICTLSNPISHLSCDACGTKRHGASIQVPSAAQSQPRPPSQSTAPPKPAPRNSINSLSSSSRNSAFPKRKLPPPSPSPSLTASRSSIKALSSLAAVQSKKPLGWVCHRCGNFMESEWWTCASCGTMKQSS
ncbi:hypothetical protein MMC13_007696 [Lambiella insularis]|nr:hypothetical protein [Lambiella insularis]